MHIATWKLLMKPKDHQTLSLSSRVGSGHETKCHQTPRPFYCTCKRVGSGNNYDVIIGSAYTHYGTCIGCCMGVGWVGIMVGMPGWFRSPASSGRRVVRVSSFSWAGRRAGLAWGGCSAWGRERKERENRTAYHSTNLKSYCLTCCTVIGGCSCSVGDLKLKGWREGGKGEGRMEERKKRRR